MTPLAYTCEQAAEVLNLGRNTVYALVASGELQSFKVGKLRRIPAEACVAFIARKVQETEEAR